MKAKIYILLFTTALLFSCKKPNKVDIVNDGNYTGVLVVTNSVKSVPDTYPITVSLKDGRFNITYQKTFKPSAGVGSYTFKNGIASFADEGIWTADFDWGLLLNGEYDIKSNATDLTLKKRSIPNPDPASPSTSYAYLQYEYILKKTN